MTEDQVKDRLQRLQRVGIAFAVIGAIVALIGLFVNVERFFEAYLFAWLFWTLTTIGGFALSMMLNLVGGRWRAIVRRVYESIARTMPFVAVAAIPLIFGMDHLYIWSIPEVVEESALIQEKVLYLNDFFFWIRMAVYFLVWLTVLFFVLKWSGEQEAHPDEYRALKLRRVSAAGLLILFFTVTFAAFDWGMSLDPIWFSSIYGIMLGLSGLMAAHALTLMVLSVLASGPPMRDELSQQISNDLGSFMLAYLMLWTYTAFSQYLIIWSGDLLEEIPWYLNRTQNGWGVVIVLIIIFHFCIPFFLLLLRDVKQNTRRLALVAATIFVTRIVELAWTIIPSYQRIGWNIHWLDFALFLAIGGLWMCVFFWQLAARPWVYVHDLKTSESVSPPLGEPADV